MKRKRTISVLVLALAATSGFAACGDDDDDDSAAPTEAAAAGSDDDESSEGSYEIVSEAAVAEGWTQMVADMTTLSADPSSATESELDEVHESWESFEGTVKDTDPDAYLAAEEALDAFLEAGAERDGTAMTAATAKMTETSTAYLVAHPG